jgi:hypothetical protein
VTGVSGSYYTLHVGRQTAKGVAQTTPQFGLKLTAGSLDATKQEIELSETDSTRQQGKTVVVAAGVSGSPDFYLRPDDFGLLAYGVLGANADSGTSPNFIHTATMSNSGANPYFTIYKSIGGNVLVDQYVDCRITGAKIKGSAGQALSASFDIAGITPKFNQTAPVLAVVTQDPLVYPNVTTQFAGTVPLTVESFEIDLMNNPDVIQGDGALTPYDIALGRLQVSGTATLLFQNANDYNTYFTGTTAGTSISSALMTERLEFNALVNANLGVDFIFQNVAITAYPVSADPSGKPIRVAIGWRAMPDAVTIANYLTIITKNAVVSY